jgi:hypothetical protein
MNVYSLRAAGFHKSVSSLLFGVSKLTTREFRKSVKSPTANGRCIVASFCDNKHNFCNSETSRIKEVVSSSRC